MPILKSLNSPQQQAVRHGQGPLLVLAGAGSGKTRVIVHRIAWLILEQKVAPRNILAVTFTNKAAGEMRERVDKLLGGGEIPQIGTFHATCARILRRDIGRLDYTGNFVIYDDKDSERLLKTILSELEIDDKKYPARYFAAAIDDSKNSGKAPDELLTNTPDRARVARVYRTYQERLKKSNALDFGDMVMLTVRLFTEFPDLLTHYQNRWQWLLVDEYQDTNPIQYELIRLLAGAAMNLCAVGDDDQSIYRWRGADIRNILDFERDFPGVTIIKLEQNYRSTQTILQAAGAVVSRNRGRKPKALWTENVAGTPIVYRRLDDDRDEARFVCREIERYGRRGGDVRSVAVFYRTNAQSRVIEDALVSDGIPYHVVGGMRFYDRMEIKDILAYLKVLENPSDEVALRRIINIPPRGIGQATIDRLAQISERKAITFNEALYVAVDEKELSPLAAAKVRAFSRLLTDFQQLSAGCSLPELTSRIMNETGYITHLREESKPEAEERIANLQQLLVAMEEFNATSEESALTSFLEQVALVSDLEQRDHSRGSVSLMTLHSAKGLEFPVVFIVGMEERLFPHARALEDEEQMEEERRLCYVGMTRARENLYLTNAHRRRLFGKDQYNSPARFLADIPGNLLDAPESAGTHGNSAKFSGSADFTPMKAGSRPVDDLSASSGHNLAAVFTPGLYQEVEVVPDESEGEVFLGMRVRHPKFGSGKIRKLEGVGNDQKVIVWFDSVGPKKLLVRFAGLERF